MPLLSKHAADVLDKKEPRTELFDDDEWNRSLTEAGAVTADMPEGRVTYAEIDAAHDDQGVDP